MEKEFSLQIDTFHEHMSEAFDCIRIAQQLEEQDHINGCDDNQNYYNEFTVTKLSRYAFLLCTIALESGGNALIKKISKNNEEYTEMEKLPILGKYETYCIHNHAKFDKSILLYQSMKELIDCRNEFVHPKPRAQVLIFDDKELKLKNNKKNCRNYPMYMNFIQTKHALCAVKDVCDFVSWYLFDLLNLDLTYGSLLIGFDSYSSMGFIEDIAHEKKIDIRCFNRKNISNN